MLGNPKKAVDSVNSLKGTNLHLVTLTGIVTTPNTLISEKASIGVDSFAYVKSLIKSLTK